jgi:hypothetical protein
MSRDYAYAALISAMLLFPQMAASQEDDRIYYGSRVGMHLTTIAKEGIGSANAVIIVKHTPQDAKAFCVEYLQDNSMKCVKRTLADVKVADRVMGDCIKRTWTDMYGRSFVIIGRLDRPGDAMNGYMTDFTIKDLATGTMLDASEASGYGTEWTIFRQLCPNLVK